jgi:hypothetical protein
MKTSSGHEAVEEGTLEVEVLEDEVECCQKRDDVADGRSPGDRSKRFVYVDTESLSESLRDEPRRWG